MKTLRQILWTSALFAGVVAFAMTSPVAADQVILDDLIVDGSICAGLDCVNGESFGFDTLRLKENNLRIKFQDTSTSASFPTNDWQLTANESSNGGQNKFSIDDIDGGRTPFTIEASAPSHSLYVDDGGRIGLGTSTPVVEVHIVDGDTPTLRLEQDGSSGFTPQTWDVAGNETNFFIRDVTNGSRLPLRIRPSAPSNSIFVDTDGDVGMGTSSPAASLNVVRSDGTAQMRVNENSGTAAGRDLVYLVNNGPTRFALENTNSTGASQIWRFNNANDGLLRISSGGAATEFQIDQSGNLTIAGTLTTAGAVYPDYVFESDYELMPLDDLRAFIEREGHLPNVSPASAVDGGRAVNMSALQIQLLEKVEELTLYTLAQQSKIDELEAANSELQALQERLVKLEKAIQ